jgi:hypothetical protein
MFSITKKTANVWHHTSDTQTVHLSTFGVVADITAQTFIVRALNGAFFPRKAVSINEIQVIDETDIVTIETFANIDELLARLIQLQYPPYKTSGGGAVDSVNGQTGVVVLDADDISETATRFWLTTALKTAYDIALAWISTNGANVLNHIASTSNPHNVTNAQVGLSNVDNTSDLNKPISTATQTALNGKITQSAIQDISLTSTIVGWSSFTTRYIGILDLGFAFLCIIDLRGVSNNSTTSITVPFTNAGGTAQGQMRVENSGTYQNTPGLASIVNNSNVINFFLTNAAASFTNSGNKAVVGQILIYKTS